MGDVRMCFEIPGGKTHYIVGAPEGQEERFPFGRALCGPIKAKGTDLLVHPRTVTKDDMCVVCVRKS